MGARFFDRLPSPASARWGATRFSAALCGAVCLSAALVPAALVPAAFAQEVRRPPAGAQTASAVPAAGAATAVTPDPIFRDPRAALRQGIEGYRAGDFAASVSALKYAADGGQREQVADTVSRLFLRQQSRRPDGQGR